MKVLLLVLSFLSVSFSCQFYIVAGDKDSNSYKIAEELTKNSSDVCIKQQSHSSSINIYNIINTQNVLFGFFQADILKNAISRDSYNKLSSLELLFPMYKETVQIAVLKDSSYSKIEDLDNKEIAVGKELDDSFMTFLLLSKDLNYDWQYVDSGIDSGIRKLLTGEVDGILTVGQAPNSKLLPILDKIRFVDISKEYFGYENTIVNRSVYSIKKDDVRYNHITDSKALGIDTILAINKNLINSNNSKLVEDLLYNYFYNKIKDAKKKPVVVKDTTAQEIEKNVELAKNKGKALLKSFGLKFGDSKDDKEKDLKKDTVVQAPKISDEEKLYNSICGINGVKYGLPINIISNNVCAKLKSEFKF